MVLQNLAVACFPTAGKIAATNRSRASRQRSARYVSSTKGYTSESRCDSREITLPVGCVASTSTTLTRQPGRGSRASPAQGFPALGRRSQHDRSNPRRVQAEDHGSEQPRWHLGESAASQPDEMRARRQRLAAAVEAKRQLYPTVAAAGSCIARSRASTRVEIPRSLISRAAEGL